MESLQVYIPIDRRLAIVQGFELPNRTTGAALFADISGFTPLTEALVQALGPQRGAEELPRWLNKIYDAVIAEVDRYRGSVTSFSGDAITCWFDDTAAQSKKEIRAQDRERMRSPGQTPAVLRATACALAIQEAMKQFAQVKVPGASAVSLAIKVAVASGPAMRFLVGDRSIQIIDVLAGKTLYQLATAEHQSKKGEVMLDEPSVTALGEQVSVKEWRVDENGEHFAVVGHLNAEVEPDPWALFIPGSLSETQVRQWILPPVYDRLMNGMGEFLTELRPTVALFLRFGGIDYEGDPQAHRKLDIYVQSVQRILARYNAYMLQLTIGDKGSYFYACFGAPLAHEDDANRAVAAALELRDQPTEAVKDLQIGVSQGTTRTGAYGGVTRRTYGALGDEVNTAARLMQHAPKHEVLVNQNVRKAAADAFAWEEMPPLKVKGKLKPLTVFRAIAKQEHRTIHLHEPKYALPMVGREAELGMIEKLLIRAVSGHGQIVGITAEAGMGKSRLMAEVIRLARRQNMLGYGGECQSIGTNTSYQVWQNIWRGFFGLDQTMTVPEQVLALERQLGQIDPDLTVRLPLLGPLLNLQIPDNDLTGSFDAKLRKESLQALLVDCVRSRSRKIPLLFVLEDCHWLDPLSEELLEAIGRAVMDLPVLIVMSYRPPQLEQLLAPHVRQLFYFKEIGLTNLPATQIEQLVSSKIKQVYGDDTDLPPALVEKITARTEGNPLYIEELLNYLHDRGIDPHQPDVLMRIELPNSLYSLILSRIDQLTENQKTLLKVASVIGRLFRAAMLWGVYYPFGVEEQVRKDLDILSGFDLTPMDTPEPELAYLFKHVLTQEVAYETLSFETRAKLHDQIGQYIEKTARDSLDRFVDLLAYHFDHSENTPKKKEYLLRAGEVAQAAFANAVAVSYYQRVLPILPENEQTGVILKLGQVLEVMGQWDKAEESYRKVELQAEKLGDDKQRAQAQHALAWLMRKRGEYAEADRWLKSARESYQQLGDLAGVSHVLADMGEILRLQGKYAEAQVFYAESLKLAETVMEPQLRMDARAHALKGAGTVATWQGDYAAARQLNQESLAIRHELGDTPGVATLLNNLGIIARFQHDLEGAHQMNLESLALFRKIGDRWAVGQLLNNQACVASDLHNYVEARTQLEESLSIRRELGDRSGLALSLNTLADVALDEGDYASVRPLLDESLAITRDLGDKAAIAYLIEDYGCLAAAENQPEPALQLAGYAAALREEIGARLPPAEQARLDRMILPARQALAEVSVSEAWQAGRAFTLEKAIELALSSSKNGGN